MFVGFLLVLEQCILYFVLDKTKDDIRVKLLEGKPRIVLKCNGGRFLHNIIRHIFLPNLSCESNFKNNSEGIY